ncbi:iron-sulfur cluster protein [Thermosporothrix hazakensis]|jgi:iron-sulfur cluster protein|uniref:Iron-sulfur cluster protein n=1 Tax=Thermosporothrix hazakensis TaxID=644383 RepID=A0A326U8S4_THEHA|nr:LUD domain-containing protein [Thermosporothrix hazakensis]PZW31985.1 iron-sulfur cluster protein [Thermosporothrix hazakensis]GCE49689.1 (Fe-S)-binding protein [Thermosporothrix hazakensis]
MTIRYQKELLVIQQRAAQNGHEHLPFPQRLDRALNDQNLQRALERFAPSWRESREKIFATAEQEYGEEFRFERLRERLKAAKDEAIERQEELVAQFKQQAEAAGAFLYEARTAEDANRYIYELCQRKGIQLVVKSKTMVSEETELNAYLEARGVTAIETDLGEWVAQLEHERPSHMVMPIIHKTRQQVGETLSRATGREISREAVAEQVAVIRKEHRKAFLTASMGVSGANALIAEGGTVMMQTNEGNGRLVTSLPPVHVVMAGYDKLLPTFADAMTQIRLLARSATAQPITSYTTFITGLSSPEREMHIILLDNGRSEMRADPRFKEALRCIRCAACANICPAYQQVGGHAFGHIYSGAIGLVVTPFHHGIEAGAGPQSLCVSCNACETVCPVEIPLPSLILDVRRKVVREKGLSPIKKAVFGIMARPRLFDILLRFGSFFQFPATRGSRFVRSRNLRLFSRLPFIGGMAALTRWRSLPALAVKPLRDRVKAYSEAQPSGTSAHLTVAYFAGCMTDRLYPEMGEAVIRVLEAAGVRVIFPHGQNCCGLPALNSGDTVNGAKMAKQTIRTLEQMIDREGVDYILSASTSCVVTVLQDYIRLFEDLDELGWLRRAQAVAERVIDFTGFMARVVLAQGVRFSVRRPGPNDTVTYHDSCQSCNCLGLRSEARTILREILDIEVQEMPRSDVCCGFGGSVSLEQPRLAERMLQQKLANAEQTGAALLVSDNPGCLMHLRGGVDAEGRPIRVLHLAQLIAEHLT